MAVKCCEHSSTYIFDRIFFVLSCNKDNYEISDEFEIRQDSTIDCGVSCPLAFENIGAGRIRTLVSIATDSSHRVTMGKML